VSQEVDGDCCSVKEKSVLIVDDSEFMRTVISDAVRQCPRLRVAGEAGDGDEALELIRKLCPDVVTLDLRMPRMQGLAVLRALKDEGLNSHVIVLSGLMDAADREESLRCGAKGVFEKTEEFEEFRRALAQL